VAGLVGHGKGTDPASIVSTARPVSHGWRQRSQK
jgi:hypothetical protein